MQITTITYGRTVNRGDYNSERLEMTGTLAEGESHEEALNTIKSAVVKGLKLEPTTSEAKAKEDKPAKKTTKKKAASKKKAETKKEEEEVKEEVKEEESSTEPKEVVDLAFIKGKLKEVAIAKGKSVAVEIVKSFGAAKSDEIDAKDYLKVLKQVEKAMK